MLTTSNLTEMTDAELTALAAQANGSPLTIEERAQIHLDSRNEARKEVRAYRRNAVIGFVILLISIAGVRLADTRGLNAHRNAVVKSGNAVAVKSCNRDFRNSLKQRVALERVQDRDEDGPVITEAERQRQIERLTPLPDCRSATTLTDEPTKKIVIPRPLHEGLLKNNKIKKRLVSGE